MFRLAALPFLWPSLFLCLTLAGCSWAQDRAKATFIGSYHWRSETVGGLSGLEVSADGSRFIAVSDRGTRHDGVFMRSEGRIIGLADTRSRPIRRLNGEPVTGQTVDAEGLACAEVHKDAACDISFEHVHRVAYFGDPDKRALNRPKSAAIRRLQLNSGLEALALDPKGRLIAIPERSGALERPFPMYRLEGRNWQDTIKLRRQPPHLVVGADFGPDGKLYVLERHFAGLGFSSRVRRFTLSNVAVLSEETLLKTPRWRHDNLEGLAVWRDATGTIRLTMVSDDNFNPLQRTTFVEYAIAGSSTKDNTATVANN